MNTREYLLVVLAEECAEVAQVASKSIRFGLLHFAPGSKISNVRRLEQEMADLLTVFEMLGLRIYEEDKDAKLAKMKKFMERSRQIGTLSE